MKTLQKTSFEKTMQKPSSQEQHSKRCLLKNKNEKAETPRTTMQQEGYEKKSMQKALLSRILKKESFQEQEFKGKLSRTRMQKQALKNYNA
jgi:hypothetical protein